MLSDVKGFTYNGVISCDEPVKYDEHIGKIAAICHELFTSTENPDGSNYLDENRTVRVLQPVLPIRIRMGSIIDIHLDHRR